MPSCKQLLNRIQSTITDHKSVPHFLSLFTVAIHERSWKFFSTSILHPFIKSELST